MSLYDEQYTNMTYYHIHSDLSFLDCATKFYKYLDRAKELGMKAFAFSEHGHFLNWIKKKEEIEKRGMKYIHALEAYVTEEISEGRKVRDNYHMIFIAKNWDGVKELNKMSSKAYFKEDGHFYYDARFTLEEVMNTSDNIMITTSCLGGILWKGRENTALVEKFMKWAYENKHRVFLEIQYHIHPDQITYNQYLYKLHLKYGFKLIAGTDTHALNQDYAMARRILMQAKGIQFTDEDKFDLTFKPYEEVIEMFRKQNAIPEKVFLDAIEFTNTMADMVEEFKIDKSPKYPHMYDTPEESEKIFKEKLNIGAKKRGFDKFSKEKKKKYFDTLHEEFEVYKKLNAIDYMLFQEEVVSWANNNDIYQGYGRGSVNGSLVSYTLGITEMDNIKHKLNFFRFLNPSRISLADIDIDYPPSRRQDVIDYVANRKGIYFSEIITFNTVAEKGAIREVGRALNIDLKVIDMIAKSVDKPSWEHDRVNFVSKYPELFKYVDLINGVNVSVGSHPSGFLVSPIPLDENIGTFYTANSKYPVSQVNMKELDGCNYVKLDILGLDNIEIINDTCKLANILRLTPDNVDDKDEKVWDSMRESTLGIFQMESDSAQAYLRELFKPETIVKIKEINPDFSYIDLLSMANGAIRPSGNSYRHELANGIFKDNGHEGMNNSLKDTMGYLVYQEQIMNWLVEFCGYTPAESDSVRRSMAKKELDGYYDKVVKPIEERFVATMNNKYSVKEDHAHEILKDILQVIDDAQRYGFSLNHSQPYSYIGYVCAYLRYYYPLEFLTVMLNINESDKKKTARIVEYATSRNIKIEPIEFGKSTAKYSFDKEKNVIYKGIGSIKYLSEVISNELYELRNNKYDCFVSLLADIVDKTSVDARQLKILIRLNFFKKFGTPSKLLSVYTEFTDGKSRYDKKHKEKTKITRLPILKEFEKNCTNSFSFSVYDQISFEIENLGYAITTFPALSEDNYLVVGIDTKYRPKITMYNLKSGEELMAKYDRKKFFTKDGLDQRFEVGDIIKVSLMQKYKPMQTESGWVDSTELESHIEKCKLIRKRHEARIKA